jgi:hypothetical protein
VAILALVSLVVGVTAIVLSSFMIADIVTDLVIKPWKRGY